MIVHRPDILVMNIQTMESKKDCLLSLGYSEEDINCIVKMNPSVYTLSIENLKGKVRYFLDKGYSTEEVIFITRKVPNLFNYSRDKIEEKFNVLQKVGLEKEILTRPAYLIQGADLSYARASFLKDRKFIFDHKAFNILLMSSTDFERKFGIKNEEVKERYPLQK